MERVIAGHDSLVTFANSQGVAGRGTLVHLTRNLVVFELYNPYSIVQLSEVLRELRVLRGERVIYSGRAVVSSLVPTGLMVIVSATLVDPWQDLAGVEPGPQLRDEVRAFVQDWEVSHALRPNYQLAVSRLRAFLGELSRWLGQVEAAAGTAERDASPAVQREFTLEVEASLTGKLTELFGAFEAEAGRVPPDEVVSHKSFARREVHPLTLTAPFIHRTFTKPLGYAGDYEMVNMILRDPLEGGNTYARILNAFILRSDGAQAHRNRIDRLLGYLHAEAERVAPGGRPLTVLNIGCGPAGEIQRFVRRDPLAGRCEMHLLDFNQETLDHARSRIEAASRDAGRRVDVRYHHMSVNDLLKAASRGALGLENSGLPRADFIYCAGLFDYLSDRICKRLLQLFYSTAEPGGLVVATNVHPRNSVRYFLEHLLEWHLVYRTEQDMLALAPEHGDRQVTADDTGANVFLEIRKPAAAGANAAHANAAQTNAAPANVANANAAGANLAAASAAEPNRGVSRGVTP